MEILTAEKDRRCSPGELKPCISSVAASDEPIARKSRAEDNESDFRHILEIYGEHGRAHACVDLVKLGSSAAARTIGNQPFA